MLAKMIKLHLHKKNGKEYGHLYSDSDDMVELLEAGRNLGLSKRSLQYHEKTMLFHFDLWDGPLGKAKTLYKTVNMRELINDLK